MMSSGVLSITIVGLVSLIPWSSLGAVVQLPDDAFVDGFAPQVRERRSQPVTFKFQEPKPTPFPFQLSGGGSEHGGTVRLDGQKRVYEGPKTSVDVNGFAQHSYQKGFPSQNSFGAGATVNHNLWKSGGHSLDAQAGYRREWNTPRRDNFGGGLSYSYKFR